MTSQSIASSNRSCNLVAPAASNVCLLNWEEYLNWEETYYLQQLKKKMYLQKKMSVNLKSYIKNRNFHPLEVVPRYATHNFKWWKLLFYNFLVWRVNKALWQGLTLSDPLWAGINAPHGIFGTRNVLLPYHDVKCIHHNHFILCNSKQVLCSQSD